MKQEISYVLSFLATTIGFIEPFNKKMSVVLVFSFVGNLLVGLSYFLTDAFSGMWICVIAGIQILLNYIFSVKEKKVPLWLIIIYAVAFCSVNVITFKAWYDIFSLAAALSFTWSIAQPNPKYYRVFLALNVGMWVIYDIFAASYGNMFMHIVSVLTILIAMFFRDRKKKTDK